MIDDLCLTAEVQKVQLLYVGWIATFCHYLQKDLFDVWKVLSEYFDAVVVVVFVLDEFGTLPVLKVVSEAFVVGLLSVFLPIFEDGRFFHEFVLEEGLFEFLGYLGYRF